MAVDGDGDGEFLAQRGYEHEAGGVVLRGGLPGSGATRAAGGHRAVRARCPLGRRGRLLECEVRDERRRRCELSFTAPDWLTYSEGALGPCRQRTPGIHSRLIVR